MITSDFFNFPDLAKKALRMEAEPCKVHEEKGEEEMEEAVRDERNMLVMEEEEKDERGAGRDAPLTILIPNSPSPPREPGGLNTDMSYSGHLSLIKVLAPTGAEYFWSSIPNPIHV